MGSEESGSTSAQEGSSLNEPGFNVRLARFIQQQELSLMMLARGSSPPSSDESIDNHVNFGSRHQALEEIAAFARVLRPSPLPLFITFRQKWSSVVLVFGERGRSLSDEFYSDDALDPDTMTYEELRALEETVGTVSKGLSSSIITAIPTQMYTRPKGSDHEGEQCTVCRCEFEEGDLVKVLPCNHCFHPACIDQWLGISKKCPICSSEVELSP